ncbi:MAG: GxxExxY protein [Candidatus Portnoybacteria bacterium]|nr:GxxExxY protein [Candidatus Portnoybacteria bacterium]
MKRKVHLRRDDLVYPELCYEIIGVLYDVHNDLGHGYREKYYQKAVARGLDNRKLSYQEQVCARVRY